MGLFWFLTVLCVSGTRVYGWIKHKTQCKIEFTYASHCVSKNLTPRRMLKTSYRLEQQLSEYVLPASGKVDHLAGKTYFVQKTPKNA